MMAPTFLFIATLHSDHALLQGPKEIPEHPAGEHHRYYEMADALACVIVAFPIYVFVMRYIVGARGASGEAGLAGKEMADVPGAAVCRVRGDRCTLGPSCRVTRVIAGL